MPSSFLKAILPALVALLLLPAARAAEQPCSPGAEGLRCRAERGDPRAQYAIGIDLFERAQAGAEDKLFAEALRWLTPSAEQGYPPAQVVLGFMYWEGWGVKPDVEKAYLWFKRAGEAGYPQAQDWLSRLDAKLTPEQRARLQAAPK